MSTSVTNAPAIATSLAGLLAALKQAAEKSNSNSDASAAAINKLQAKIIVNKLKAAISAGDTAELVQMLNGKVLSMPALIAAVINMSPGERHVDTLKFIASHGCNISRSTALKIGILGDTQLFEYILKPSSGFTHEVAFTALIMADADRWEIMNVPWFVQNMPAPMCYNMVHTRQLLENDNPAKDDDGLIRRFEGTYSWPIDIDRKAVYVRCELLRYVVNKITKIKERAAAANNK